MQMNDYRQSIATRLVVPAMLVLGLTAAAVGITAKGRESVYPSSSFPPPYSGPRVTIDAKQGDTFYGLTQDCPPSFTNADGRNYKPRHPGQYWADDAARASGKSPGEVLRIGEDVNLPVICRN